MCSSDLPCKIDSYLPLLPIMGYRSWDTDHGIQFRECFNIIKIFSLAVVNDCWEQLVYFPLYFFQIVYFLTLFSMLKPLLLRYIRNSRPTDDATPFREAILLQTLTKVQSERPRLLVILSAKIGAFFTL